MGSLAGIAFKTQSLAGFGDARRLVSQRLEKPADAVSVQRRAYEYRTDITGLQFGDEITEHEILLGIDVLEQLFHQHIVVIGDLLEHFETGLDLARLLLVRDFDNFAGGMFLIDVRAFECQVDKTGRNAVFPNRYLPDDQRHRRCRLQRLQQAPDAAAELVDLVDEQKMRNAAFFKGSQNCLQCGKFLVVGLCHDDGDINDCERSVGLALEFH